MFIIGKEEVLHNKITVRTASEIKKWNTLERFLNECEDFDNKKNSC